MAANTGRYRHSASSLPGDAESPLPADPEGRRVLIMSVGAGNGHIRAAQALEQRFATDGRVTEVINCDVLQYTNKLFRNFYSKFYASLITSAPNFLGWWYKTSDEPWRTDSMRHMIDRLNTQPLVRFIRDFDPHVTVCTHFMPAGIISHLIATGKLQAHLSIVVTDFDFHAMWLSRSFQRYFVALDETRAFLEMLGLPPERITVSGIPIDQRFGLPLDRESALRGHELNPQLPTLLLSAGALGQDEAAFTVERLLALRHDVQVIVVCGRNSDLRQRIEGLTAQRRQRYRVLGYTDDMHHWMKLSDLYIGKPGGLTSSEAVACGLPMCIVNPIPGQEERNADHLLENGIAIKCNEPGTLGFKLDRLLDDPAKLRDMRRQALRFARPNAAATVVNTLLADSLPPLALIPKKTAPALSGRRKNTPL